MIIRMPFNKIKKILSVVLLIFLVLPLSRCEPYSGPKKPIESTQPETVAQQVTPVKFFDENNFYVFRALSNSLKDILDEGWVDRLISVLMVSLLMMIFLPLCLWRLSETKSAVVMLSFSPMILYSLFISVWMWPVQLIAGYLLTGIWLILFVLSLFQTYVYFREKRRARLE